jgi:ATP-dependent Zn protease
MDLAGMGSGTSVLIRDTDTASSRERNRNRRLQRTAFGLGALLLALALFAAAGRPVRMDQFPWIHLSSSMGLYLPAMVLCVVLVLSLVLPYMASGRSPHTVFRADEIGLKLDDVVGAGHTKAEAVRTLNLFLAHRTFAETMGGSARRGVLFEGLPGTGKTYLAKAMAGSASVPFVYLSATSLQSQFYGASARKIRSFFAVLRKLAREEGGAIGFIEEIDAIAQTRSSGGHGSMHESPAGVVNELLVQMQSFEVPTRSHRVASAFVERINRWLPADRRLRRPPLRQPNVLLVAATNRAESLDPAILRPGRFDRVITFDLPARRDREEIAAYYLKRKAHDEFILADDVAELTTGYTPVAIERLLDEALICALQQGRRYMVWADILEAKLVNEVGLARDGAYSADERWRIAVHESGHAVTALIHGRAVGVVSILKRASSLGVTTHHEHDEQNIVTRTQALGHIEIALAGMIAEEILCGEASSTASSDLANATGVAAMLVGALGMGPSLLSLEAAAVAGAGNLVAKVLADEPSRDAADRLLAESRSSVTKLLMHHESSLRACAERLVERDEIAGVELAQLMAKHAPVDA